MEWENRIFYEVIDEEFARLKDYKRDKIYWFLPHEIDVTWLFAHIIDVQPLIALVFKDLNDPYSRLKIGFNKNAKEVFRANKGDFREILRHELLHLETGQNEGEKEFERERAKRGIILLSSELKNWKKIIEVIYKT